MMTPQEVANCTFAKSMMGGYNICLLYTSDAADEQ